MNLYQLRDCLNETDQIVVRRHNTTKVPPEAFAPVYLRDNPVALTLLVETESNDPDFDPNLDYLITLDRQLPFIPIGTVLQIG